MSLFNQENIIGTQSAHNHKISKYEFKSITQSSDTQTPQEEAPQPLVQESIPQVEEPKTPSLEKELVDRLLQKSDELSDSLAKLQLQFEKAQNQAEEQLNTAKDEAYKEGYNQAKEEIKSEIQEEFNTQKKILVDSIITLENTLKDSQAHLQNLEKELSAIAVDIAKEVIVKEIEENSQKVALALAKELLHSIMDATDITLKVNPQDYLYLKEQLENAQKDTMQKITILADDALKPGGVIIISNQGNVDGSIMTRYKNMKQSILDNMREI
ncbi:flagellar assembly protein FliH [uncultured Helicobacter sp.]|uniref:flagellar assembly protein FliH n=1 Tax=uncultured Helicobacter sp. TaxID=175537 RepID=UPI001C39DE4F|nr:flagellar assembly protein FliH [Candidatus Helicobacter avicola]